MRKRKCSKFEFQKTPTTFGGIVFILVLPRPHFFSPFLPLSLSPSHISPLSLPSIYPSLSSLLSPLSLTSSLSLISLSSLFLSPLSPFHFSTFLRHLNFVFLFPRHSSLSFSFAFLFAHCLFE